MFTSSFTIKKYPQKAKADKSMYFAIGAVEGGVVAKDLESGKIARSVSQDRCYTR